MKYNINTPSERVEDIKNDLSIMIDACITIGLGDIAHVLNEALNLIEDLEVESDNVAMAQIAVESTIPNIARKLVNLAEIPSITEKTNKEVTHGR